MAALRQLTPREQLLVDKFSAQHAPVRAFAQPIADDAGDVSSPLIRVSMLAQLERRGTITSAEAQAGDRFHRLFRVAALDSLRAADMGRTPAAAGYRAIELSDSSERARRRVSAAMAALGGAGAPAAGVAWNVLGMEMSLRQWAIASQRQHQVATGILVAALGMLAAHFGPGRQRRG